jgi:hypothetical protein
MMRASPRAVRGVSGRAPKRQVGRVEQAEASAGPKAVIPPLTGQLADSTGSLGLAFSLPALRYAVTAGFGLFTRRTAAT